MDLKKLAIRALRNIVHKQAQMNMSSRFLFMKILKNISALDALASLEELKVQKFVKEKSYERIFLEMQRLSKEEDFKDLSLSNNKSTLGHPHQNMIVTGTTISKPDGVQRLLEFDDYCDSDEDSYLERLRSTYKDVSRSALPPINLDESQVAQGTEDSNLNYYSDSSIIVCDHVKFQKLDANSSDCMVITDKLTSRAPECKIADEEEIFNSLSDLRLDGSRPNHPTASPFKVIDPHKENDASAGRNNVRPANSPKTSAIDKIDETIIPDNASTAPSARKTKRRRYIPGYRTAPYAILKALHEHNGSHKHLVALKATQYTNTELDGHQAFSAFKALVKKELVYLEANSKYYLTQAGHELCGVLFSGSPTPPMEDQEIKLVIDSREKKSGRDRVYFQSYFLSKNIPNETRFLSVGDFLWIRNEHILKYIVERKQCSDFASSVSDGRYKEQKNRLQRLDMRVYYLVENLRVEESRENYVQRCLLETRIDGFVVLETESIAESALALEMIDKRIRKQLLDGPEPYLVQARPEDSIDHSKATGPHAHCAMSYGSFLKETDKNNFKVKDMLMMALLGIKGLSKGFAIALSEKYLTLSNFRKNIANAAFKHEIRSFKPGGRELGEKMAERVINLLR